MWYAVANAASQLIVNPLMAAVAPRSSCSHWGSLNAADHRVDRSPSTAAEAAVPAFSADDAVASEPSAMLTSAACAARCGPMASKPATRASTARPSRTWRVVNGNERFTGSGKVDSLRKRFQQHGCLSVFRLPHDSEF